MGSKLGFILTLFFVVEAIAYSGDLYSVQAIHSLLDSTALTVAKKISLDGYVSSQTLLLIKKNKATFVPENSSIPQVGDVYVFTLKREYQPLIMSKSSLSIEVTRSTVIGYLD